MTERENQRRLDALAMCYLTAIEAGDLNTVSALWAKADDDPVLGEMLYGLNAELAADRDTTEQPFLSLGDEPMASKAKKFRSTKKPASSVRQRILQLFLKNVGRVVTRVQIQQAARDPKTKKIPENWHQRLSELRTDFGYNIQSHRDTQELGVSEYRLVSATPGPVAGKRVKITPAAWTQVLERADHACEWEEDGKRCGLKAGDTDPVGGGTTKLTPDHKTPHSVNPNIDPANSDEWQALCGRHQVMKKNFWDHRTGKLNVYAIVQAASEQDKRAVYDFLKAYFGD